MNPKIYSYLDYRMYLKDYYIHQKESSPHFTYRYFSKRVGVKAPNFLQWLIEGKRNLAKKTIPKVAAVLGLNEKEGRYFETIVFFDQAKTIREKTVFFEELITSHKHINAKQLTKVQYEHYRNWYNEAIRELLNHQPFDPKEKWAYRKLGKKLCPAITESEARSAIKQLLQLGLVKEDNDGMIRQAEKFITTGDEVRSFFVQKFHENMIALAGEAMDRFPSEFRDVSSVTMSVSDECFELIKKEVQQTRKRIMELVKHDKKPDSVYQVNFQLFPLVPKKKAQE